MKIVKDAANGRAKFIPIPDAETFTSLFHRPAEEPVVLFLHDPWCPISADAEDEMRATGLDVHLVDVSTQHDLKQLTAQFTGVKHESPQVFILRDGRPTWNASHRRIRTEAVIEAASAPAAATDTQG